MRFSDTVNRVIDLATTIHDYWERELPKRHPDYPLVDLDADNGPPPPEEADLRHLLESLPPDEVYKLMALRNLGRDYFSASDFGRQWRELEKQYPDTGSVIWHLMETPPLGDQLHYALEVLAAAGIGVDSLGSVAA